MDSYNRGYHAGLGSGIDGLGSASDGTVKIGNATLSYNLADANMDAAGAAANFYAVAYQWGSQTVIAYRGTDAILQDAWTGWAVGAGAAIDGPAYAPGSQAGLAIDFYTSVTGEGVFDGAATNVILTGHSLGGGLAGYIGALTGTSATIFDNMPYSAAAFVTWLAHAAYQTGIAVEDMLDGNGNLLPEYAPPSSSGITSFNVDGEILEAVRMLEPNAAALTFGMLGVAAGAYASIAPSYEHRTEFAAPGTGYLDALNLHGQGFQITLMFASEEEAALRLSSAWRTSGMSESLIKSLFKDGIGRSIGLKTATGDDPGTGIAVESGQMQSMIAYSALDEGHLLFGDAAIRVLFNDLTDVGIAKNSGSFASLSSSNVRDSLADILVGYAGLLAKNKVIHDDGRVQNSLDGVVQYDGSTVTVSLDRDAKWLHLANIAGVNELATSLIVDSTYNLGDNSLQAYLSTVLLPSIDGNFANAVQIRLGKDGVDHNFTFEVNPLHPEAGVIFFRRGWR